MWICLAVFLVILSVVRAQHQCYVCVPPKGSGGEVERLFPNTKLSVCGDTMDAKVCPEGYKGCLTQTRGNMVTRTCSDLGVDETCQEVNGVQYCYCRGQLCNDSSKSSNKPPPDDEDIGEGSGSEATLNTKSTTQEQLPKLTTTAPFQTGGSGIIASSNLVIVIGIVSLYLLCC